jgi:hypothetical protein
MRFALIFLAACYSPSARDWPDTDAVGPSSVSLAITIMGPGRITIVDVGTCDSATAPHGQCTFMVPPNAMRELQAAATQEDHPFVSWSQGCMGMTATCSVLPVMSPTQVGAKFQ